MTIVQGAELKRPLSGPRKGEGLRVLLYAGLLRPRIKPDPALMLLKRIQQRRHTVVTLIARADDPLRKQVERMGIPVSPLPEALTQPFRTVHDLYRRDPSVRRKIERWADELAARQPDIGVVFYGLWIPPALFNMPRLGFINYHPAPLPELRGMEPDTMAVLLGLKTMSGTVHRVTLNYDDGPIYARTRRMRLNRYTTPKAIFETLTEYGTRTIIRVLDRLERDAIKPIPQGRQTLGNATRQRVRDASVIPWDTDTIEMIERRRRAFLGQDIGIRLKAEVDGTLYAVNDIETHAGTYPGRPGQVVGRYIGAGKFRGCPMLRARDGVAVVLTGPVLDAGTDARRENTSAPWLLPSGRQATVTKRALIRRSVRRT